MGGHGFEPWSSRPKRDRIGQATLSTRGGNRRLDRADGLERVVVGVGGARARRPTGCRGFRPFALACFQTLLYRFCSSPDAVMNLETRHAFNRIGSVRPPCGVLRPDYTEVGRRGPPAQITEPFSSGAGSSHRPPLAVRSVVGTASPRAFPRSRHLQRGRLTPRSRRVPRAPTPYFQGVRPSARPTRGGAEPAHCSSGCQP